MARGIMCNCGCKAIITEINPQTGKPYAKCVNSRKEYKKRETKRRNTQRKQMTHARTASGSLIYDTAAWKRLSEKKRVISPYCEECFEKGRGYVLADVVDHIKEVMDHPELAYNFKNLRSLCHQCHNTKTKQVAKDRDMFEFV